jgi:hypothetical protein
MKTSKLFIVALFAVSVAVVGCTEKKEFKADVVPSNFKVDIPSSLSNKDASKADKDGVLNGNDIYGHLGTFIAVGEGAADIVQGIIMAIREYNLDQAMSFSFQSEEDGRTKTITVIENSEFEGSVWEYQLTMIDEDGGTGMQIFWNNSPVIGIAILNPYNIDRTQVNEWSESEQWTDVNTMYRVDYSETDQVYEQKMVVYISGLKLPEDLTGDNRFAMQTMKMFAGKRGDIVDVYGNSNHPYASFFDNNTVGFNWAFVAAGDESTDKAVAVVGLPPSNLDETDRDVLLLTYSLHDVFYNELMELGYSENDILDFIYNTQAPGYFNEYGFVSAGQSPSVAYDAAEASIQNLTPYNPVLVTNLSIQFKDDDAS